jgi:transposase
MKNHQIGIDISKGKVNICLRGERKSVWESESPNTVASVKKAIRKSLKENGIASDAVIVCAEHTGRYIYPLVCACDELGVFLWMEDPTRIKNSFGIARGKDDKADARRIAEYADRFSDKAVAYGIPNRTLASIKSKLADRDMLLEDRKRYEAQLHDRKGFMDPEDYAQKSRLWTAVIKTLNKQLALLDEQLAALVASDERTSRQVELLKSVDGVGDRIALYMVAVTMGFTRFQNPRQFFCYAGLAPFRYTSGKSIHSKSKVSQRANKHVKALLHLAAVSAATHMKDSEYRRYYERKTAEGSIPCRCSTWSGQSSSAACSPSSKETPNTKKLYLFQHP